MKRLFFDRSGEWRQRAEEYRVLAERARTEAARRSYFEVALNCDLMARSYERLRNAPDTVRVIDEQFLSTPSR